MELLVLNYIAAGLAIIAGYFVFRNDVKLFLHHRKLWKAQMLEVRSKALDEMDLAILQAIAPKIEVKRLKELLIRNALDEYAARQRIDKRLAWLSKDEYICLMHPAPSNRRSKAVVTESMECSLTDLGKRQLKKMLFDRGKIVIEPYVHA